MVVGFPADKQAIDAHVGSLAVRVRDSLADCERTADILLAMGESTLIAQGYTQEDVNVLRAAFGQLSKLARVARGADTVPVADNFFFHSRKLTGLK